MEKNTSLYYKSAVEFGLPVIEIPDAIYGFAICFSDKPYFFHCCETPFNNSGSVVIARSKHCVNRMLFAAGIPVPKTMGIMKDGFDEGEYPLEDLKFPVVAKPTIDSALGDDVLCNIKSREILYGYLKKKFADSEHKCFSIEEFHDGLKSYRVLVFYGKVIGVVERTPASVVGDGVNTIEQLIDIANKERVKIGEKVSLGPIRVDEETHIRLNELGLTLNYIPKKDEYIKLCYGCNSTRGGTMTSLGKRICQENADLAIRAANTLNLNIVGFDVLCEDINTPILKSRGFFIEANHNPDVSIHESPMFGCENRVTKIILRKFIYHHFFAYLKYRFKKIQFIRSIYFRFAAIMLFTIIIAKNFMLVPG